VYGEGNGVVAKLVSTEPRFLLQKGTTVSVPLAALTAAMDDTLESTGKLPVAPPPPMVPSRFRGGADKARCRA
jgi:hypothetical protein